MPSGYCIVGPDHRSLPRDTSADSWDDSGPMRIVSLVPAATEIVHALGLGDQLVGRSHACDFPDDVIGVPVVTTGDPDVHARHLDHRLLAQLEPDLVLADGSDDEPLVDYREISDAVGALRRDVSLVALAPQSVEGILNSISTVGAFTEAEYEAVGLVDALQRWLLHSTFVGH